VGGSRGSYANFGWFLTLKSVSDPCQCSNRWVWKRMCEIDSFRKTLCERVGFLCFGKDESTALNAFLNMPGPQLRITLGTNGRPRALLVVRNTKKGTTISAVITISVVRIDCAHRSKILFFFLLLRDWTPSPPRLAEKSGADILFTK
jgi:hypothetical protein